MVPAALAWARSVSTPASRGPCCHAAQDRSFAACSTPIHAFAFRVPRAASAAWVSLPSPTGLLLRGVFDAEPRPRVEVSRAASAAWGSLPGPGQDCSFAGFFDTESRPSRWAVTGGRRPPHGRVAKARQGLLLRGVFRRHYAPRVGLLRALRALCWLELCRRLLERTPGASRPLLV